MSQINIVATGSHLIFCLAKKLAKQNLLLNGFMKLGPNVNQIKMVFRLFTYNMLQLRNGGSKIQGKSFSKLCLQIWSHRFCLPCLNISRNFFTFFLRSLLHATFGVSWRWVYICHAIASSLTQMFQIPAGIWPICLYHLAGLFV